MKLFNVKHALIINCISSNYWSPTPLTHIKDVYIVEADWCIPPSKDHHLVLNQRTRMSTEIVKELLCNKF